jgi:BASS family bile acid:Na+ symporter
LIKLTQRAQHSIALGAAVMLMLMLVTVLYLPIVLPLILSGISVDGWAIAKSLSLQLLLPIVVGMLVVPCLPGLARKAQPWVARLANISLYVLMAATVIGYLPNMTSIIGTGAIFVGLLFVLGAFGRGYLTGAGKDHLEDVGGLGTAQRNCRGSNRRDPKLRRLSRCAGDHDAREHARHCHAFVHREVFEPGQ